MSQPNLREPARTAKEAQDRYLRFLQRSLSCVTNAVWAAGRPPKAAADNQRSVTVNPDPARLPTDNGVPLLLSAGQRYEFVDDDRYPGEVKIRTLGYVYTVSLGGADPPEELINWHWHPGPEARQDPHLHLCVEHPVLAPGMARLHIPSGRVAFEGIVRMLIEDLHVRPNRPDWDEVLSDSETRFRAYRSWA